MDTPEALMVLRDLARDDLLDPAQQQAIGVAIAALEGIRQKELERIEVPQCSVCGRPATSWGVGGSRAACSDHQYGLEAYFR